MGGVPCGERSVHEPHQPLLIGLYAWEAKAHEVAVWVAMSATPHDLQLLPWTTALVVAFFVLL